MTDAQWLFEYMLLRERERNKEKETYELINQSLKAIKQLLINILGLNLVPGDKDDEKERIIPLSLMTARREILELMLEHFNQEEQIDTIMKDDEFEALSQAIANGEDLGDMSPLFEVDEKLDQQLNEWFTPHRETELHRLGVKIVDEPLGKISHHEVDGEVIKQKKQQDALERQTVKKEIEKQIKEESKRHKSRNVQVTFDTDDA